MPQPVARMGDMHACPIVVPPLGAHGSGPILPPACPTVLTGGQPTARVGDLCLCAPPAPPPGPAAIMPPGNPTVLVGGKPIARMGDPTAHGGVILPPCCPTVLA
jgi:uncharacterized Zn-binding protein involved in type VI secretion